MDNKSLLAKLNTLKTLQDIDFNCLDNEDKFKFESYHKGYITAINNVITIIEEENTQ